MTTKDDYYPPMPARMTPEYVAQRVALIQSQSDDDERAHSMEDDLHQQVLRSIAEGTCSNPVQSANEALKTLKIDFCRWCA